ncbi:DUF4919 domain-containing protein [bacterium]|nr:MAG: DUF4919 domain-containing protein [bacterium]
MAPKLSVLGGAALAFLLCGPGAPARAAAADRVPVDPARVRAWTQRGASAVPELIQVLGSSTTVGERLDALFALAGLGPTSAPAVPALLGLLRRVDRYADDPRMTEEWFARQAEGEWAARALAAAGDAAVAPILASFEERRFPARRSGEALAAMGPAALPRLLEKLEVGPPVVRERIATVLGASRPVRPESVRALERLCAADQEWETRYAALKALEELGPAARAAAPTLKALLEDRGVGRVASEALAAVGGEPRQAAEVLIRELRTLDDSLMQEQYVEPLGRTAAEVPEALDALIEALRTSPHVKVRVASARALGRLGPAGRAAVIPLILATEDEGRDLDSNRSVQDESRAALSFIGAPDPAAADDLVLLLDHRENDVRLSAAEALGRIGPPARAAVPALAARISQEEAMGGTFAKAIEDIGEAGPEAVAILEKATEDRDPGHWAVPQQAALALAQLGRGREASLRYFRRTFNSRLRSDESKIPSAEGLRRWGEEEGRVLRFLTDIVRRTAVDGAEPWVAQRATDVLARYGAKADRAVPAVVSWLERNSDWYQESGLAALRAIGTERALAALSRFGPAAQEALPAAPTPLPRLRAPSPVEALAYSLRNAADVQERARSARRLGELGEAARPALPALLFAAGDEPPVAEASAAALERIGAPEPAQASALTRLLYDEQPGTAIETAKALGRIGPPAKAAADVLAHFVSSHERRLACPAAEALGRIGAVTPEVLGPLRELVAELHTWTPWDSALCAAHALIALGEERDVVRSFLTGLLASDSLAVRRDAEEGFRRLGEPVPAPPKDRPGPAPPAPGAAPHRAPLPAGAAARFHAPTAEGSERGIIALAFSPDGKTFAATGGDGSVRLFSAADGRELRTFSSHRGEARAAAFSPDGALLATGGEDGLVILHETRGGRVRRVIRPGRVSVDRLAFSPDGKELLSTGARHNVEVWDVATGANLRSMLERPEPLKALALSPDGRFLAATSGYLPLTLSERHTGRVVFERGLAPRLGTNVAELAFAADGASLVVRDYNSKTLYLVSVPGGEVLKSFPLDDRVGAVGTRRGQPSLLLAYAAEAGDTWSLDLLDPADGRRLTVFRNQAEAGGALAVSPDGRLAAVAGPDATGLLWRLDGPPLPPQADDKATGLSTGAMRELIASWEEPARADAYFDGLRRRYAESAAYDPYGEGTRRRSEALAQAIDDEDYAQALPLANALLADHPVLLDAHDHAATAAAQLGDRERGLYHQRVARGLMDSLRRSGDGKSPATAYRVVYLGEEGAALSGLAGGRELEGRSSLEAGGRHYDAWTFSAGADAAAETVYFDVENLWAWTLRRLGD